MRAVEMYVCSCMWLYLGCIPTRGERSRQREVGAGTGVRAALVSERSRGRKCGARCEAIMPVVTCL